MTRYAKTHAIFLAKRYPGTWVPYEQRPNFKPMEVRYDSKSGVEHRPIL